MQQEDKNAAAADIHFKHPRNAVEIPNSDFVDVYTDLSGGLVGEKRPRERTNSGNPKEKKKPAQVTPDTGSVSNLPSKEEAPLINPRSRERNSRRKLDMDTIDQDVPMEQAAVMSGQQQGPNLTGFNKATIPDYSLPRELGVFTETRTAHLPLTLYMSFNKVSQTYSGSGRMPNVLQIRMNSPYNILDKNVFVKQIFGQPRSQGLGTIPCPNAGNTNPNVANRQALYTLDPGFADSATAETKTATASICYPGWLRYYQKVWQHYAMLETRYKITLSHQTQQKEDATDAHDVVIVENWDTITAQDSGNVMPVTADVLTLENARNWKRVKLHNLSNNRRQDGSTNTSVVLSGVWKPNKLRKDTENEEDTKVWHNVGSFTPDAGEKFKGTMSGGEPSPIDFEYCTLAAFMHEYSTSNSSTVNIKVELDYIVQFRDLKNEYRFPNPKVTTSSTTLVMPDDTWQYPSGRLTKTLAI